MPAPKITKEEYCKAAIESAMKLKRYNQAKLAKRLNLSQGAVCGYLRNIYGVRAEQILRLSDILGIDIFSVMTKFWREERK